MASGQILQMTAACDIEMEVLSKRLVGRCWVLDNFPFDVLLGLDFLRQTNFLLDFQGMRLINPEIERGLCTTLSVFPPLLCRETCSIYNSAYAPCTVTEIPPTPGPMTRPVFDAGMKKQGQMELASYSGPRPAELISRGAEDLVATACVAVGGNPVGAPAEDVAEGTIAQADEACGGPVFGNLTDDDGLIDPDEHWIPVKKDLEKSWPMEKDYYESVFETLRCGPELTAEQKAELLTVCREFPEAFPSPTAKLGLCTAGVHRIPTGDSEPIYEPPRRLSPWHATEINRQVAEWKELDVVKECASPWGHNIFLVKKKGPDGETLYRPVLDMRALNKITKKDRFPMAFIQELFDRLSGAKYFTLLDQAQGYLQIPIAEEDQEKTAFIVPGLQGRQYCFKRMIFGLTSAPATYTRILHELFKDEKLKYLLCYLDDLLVFSQTWEEHLQHIREVLSKLSSVGLKLKPSKCRWGMTSTIFLGHLISREGISPDPEKIRAIEQYPRPTDLKASRTFVGMVCYYARFIQGLSGISRPLTMLTQKDQPFTWGERQETAFQVMKQKLMSFPILRHFNPDFDCEVHTDGSLKGVSATLIQTSGSDEFVVAYASKGLNKSQCNYAATQLELLAVVYGVEKFDCYLAGNRPFKIVTDHSALVPLMRTKFPVGRLARFVFRLQHYNFTVVYRPGKQNQLCDALSRYPCPEDAPAEACVSAALLFVPELDVANQQRQDAFCKTIIEVLEGGTETVEYRHRILYYVLKKNVLYRRVFRGTPLQDALLLVVPRSLKNFVLEEAHDAVMGGHLGVKRTYQRIHDRYWWPGCISDVSLHVTSCDGCQKKKADHNRPSGYLQPLLVSGAFHRVHFDYSGPYPISRRRNQYLLVAICPLTKCILLRAVAAATAQNAARFLVERIVLSHGTPVELLTDQGKHFTGQMLQHILKLLHVRHLTTTPYHARSDGQAERAIQTVNSVLSHFVDHETQRNWCEAIPYVEWVVNTMRNETTGFSAFQLVYGRVPLSPLDAMMGYDGLREIQTPSEYAMETQEWLEKAREIAQEKVNSSHDKEAPRFNAKRSDQSYQVGDLVLRWRPVQSLGLANKLVPKYSGPFEVLSKEANGVNYEIRMLNSRKKSVVVHVESLKPYNKRAGDTEQEELEVPEDPIGPDPTF